MRFTERQTWTARPVAARAITGFHRVRPEGLAAAMAARALVIDTRSVAQRRHDGECAGDRPQRNGVQDLAAIVM
jgi:hypothetical protein